MADALFSIKKYIEARDCYIVCLSIEPDNDRAQQGLQGIQQFIINDQVLNQV